MNRKCIRWSGGIAAALTLTLGSPASATEYGVKGSDTLFDVMTDAISAYKTELGLGNCTTQDCIKYLGTGSGNGEKAMALHSISPKQRIAPMSRNMTGTAKAVCETGTFTDSSGTTTRGVPNAGGVGAGLCYAELKNVLGLDAAVIVEGSSACKNIQPGTDPIDNTIAADDNQLQLILGGKGGTGDWVACTHPDRVKAIDALLTCNVGLGAFSNFFRRDDSSGTSDTMREKLKIQRFCNGEGKPAAGTLNANLLNPDNDPLRMTSCPAGMPGARMPVTCTVTDPSSTNYLKDCSSKRCSGGGTVTNQFGTFTISGGVAACVTDADCAALPGGTWGTCSLGLDPTTPGCTSGFVVSLSEPDPGQSDITMTIAKRAATDASNIGYAGRESVRKSTAFGPTLNTNQASDGNVRGDTYLLSRRLWLQDTCNQVSGTPVTTDSTDQSPGRDAAECQFFQWATDELPQVSQKAGRENIDPILKRWGFITCTDDNSQPTGNGNLCSKNYADGSGFPNGAGAPNKCILNNATTSGWTAKACTGTDPCCSDGKACNDNSHGDGAGGFKCPAPAGRAKGAACRFDAECASASCDGFATATVGACL